MFEEKQEPYEILIRFEGGKYKGAHFQATNVLYKDGAVVTQTLLAPVPIKDAEGFKLADVVGQVLIDQDEAVRLAQQDVEAARAAAREEVAKANEAIAERLAELDDPALVMKLEAQLAAKDANIQALMEA
jgi:hypothetical protein